MLFSKNKHNAILVILIIVLGNMSLGFAETSNDDPTLKGVNKETQDLIKAIKGYSYEQRDEALDETKAALDDLDKRIDAMETHVDNNWDKMNKAAREKMRSNLSALRKQRTQVAEWYGGLRSSSTDAWQEMKKGFSDAYTALYDAWQASEKEFTSSK